MPALAAVGGKGGGVPGWRESGNPAAAGAAARTFEEECEFLSEDAAQPGRYHIRQGFVPNMRVPGIFYVNDHLRELMYDELKQHTTRNGFGGFLPAVKQIANVACLPGIVRASVAMPDCHSGYGFAIGNVAAFDMGDPDAVVCPGGVGFDINCGVRLLRTNLTEADVGPV